MACELNNGGCDQVCTNTNFTSECECDMGFTLADDGRSCNGMRILLAKAASYNG